MVKDRIRVKAEKVKYVAKDKKKKKTKRKSVKNSQIAKFFVL